MKKFLFLVLAVMAMALGPPAMASMSQTFLNAETAKAMPYAAFLPAAATAPIRATVVIADSMRSRQTPNLANFYLTNMTGTDGASAIRANYKPGPDGILLV